MGGGESRDELDAAMARRWIAIADVPPAGVKMAKPNGDHARMLETGRWKVMCSFPFAVIRTSAMPDAGT